MIHYRPVCTSGHSLDVHMACANDPASFAPHVHVSLSRDGIGAADAQSAVVRVWSSYPLRRNAISPGLCGLPSLGYTGLAAFILPITSFLPVDRSRRELLAWFRGGRKLWHSCERARIDRRPCKRYRLVSLLVLCSGRFRARKKGNQCNKSSNLSIWIGMFETDRWIGR